MDEIRLLAITGLISAGTYLYYGRIRPIKDLFGRRDLVLRDAAYGLCELRLPKGWRGAKELNDGAGIEVIDPLRGRYALIMSEWRDDYDASYTLEEFSSSTRAQLTSDLLLLATSAPESRSVGGLRAIQFEIEAVHDRTEIKYLHTSIQGRRAFHQVIAWATRRCCSRPAFDELLKGFAETPGDETIPLPRAMPRPVRRIGFTALE